MQMKKLPDMEFEFMKAIWTLGGPITSPILTAYLAETVPEKGWKQQTVLTGLSRLERKGYLYSVKNGKERKYHLMVSQDAYLELEAKNFRHRFSGIPLSRLVKALSDAGEISENDINELKEWLENMTKPEKK